MNFCSTVVLRLSPFLCFHWQVQCYMKVDEILDRTLTTDTIDKDTRKGATT